MNYEDVTEVWRRYDKGREHHNRMNLYSDTDKCWRFYQDDQWYGLERDNEILPFKNFIKPHVKYKTAIIAQNNMSINYSPMNIENQQQMVEICDKLNKFAASKWELQKMESKAWEIVKTANITGDSYLYFYDSELNCQIIDRKNIYLSDEQESDIQKQKYIILWERRFVDDVKKDAEANGIDEAEIRNIIADDDTENLSDNGKNEVKTKDGKCSCLVELSKKDGIIHVRRSTKTVVYQEDTPIKGLTLYPIASLVIEKKYESARGNGEVLPLIPNQIVTNRMLARREVNITTTGFAKPVYNENAIANPADINKVGVGIRISSNVQNIRQIFDYIAPSPMSPDAKAFQDELLNDTRELAGSGDSALGNVDPTKASGAAIIAVRDQTLIPMNEPIAVYKQFAEDIGNIWFAVWIAYNPNGMEITYKQDGETVSEVIPAEILTELSVHTRIDVSRASAYDKYAREQSLENALAQQHITFEEYVSSLDDDATAPKGKFESVLEEREKKAQDEMMSIIQQQAQLIESLQAEGGVNGGMSDMQNPNDDLQLPLQNGQ